MACGRRPYPFGFSEAKISMALYLRWRDLKDGKGAEFEKAFNASGTSEASPADISSRQVDE